MIVVCLLLLCCSAFAQSSNRLQVDSLMVGLHQVIETQRSIELEEIKGVYKLTPWHFVPSLNYDFINNNYYVTISSSAFVSNMIGKRQEARRISAATRKYSNQIKSAEIKLKSLLLSVNHNIENLYLSHVIVSNDIEIYTIKFSEHSENEIDTETYLKERSSILNKIKNHNSEVSGIQKQLLEIELLTETELNIDLSEFFVSPAKIIQANGR